MKDNNSNLRIYFMIIMSKGHEHMIFMEILKYKSAIKYVNVGQTASFDLFST